MKAKQRKFCNVMVEPEFSGPRGWRMTSFAFTAELPFVWVRFAMACSAIPWQRTNVGLNMTLVTFEFLMTGWQRKVGLCGMIEIRRAPMLDVVAVLTLAAKLPFVCIIIAMASFTCAAIQIVMIIRTMTRAAGELPMRTHKRETGDGEVIKGNAVPVFRQMTAATFAAILPLVNVVGLMAGHACFADIRKIFR